MRKRIFLAVSTSDLATRNRTFFPPCRIRSTALKAEKGWGRCRRALRVRTHCRSGGQSLLEVLGGDPTPHPPAVTPSGQLQSATLSPRAVTELRDHGACALAAWSRARPTPRCLSPCGDWCVIRGPMRRKGGRWPLGARPDGCASIYSAPTSQGWTWPLTGQGVGEGAEEATGGKARYLR